MIILVFIIILFYLKYMYKESNINFFKFSCILFLLNFIKKNRGIININIIGIEVC